MQKLKRFVGVSIVIGAALSGGVAVAQSVPSSTTTTTPTETTVTTTTPPTTTSTTLPQCLPDGSIPDGAEGCVAPAPGGEPTTSTPQCLPDGSIPDGAESCQAPIPPLVLPGTASPAEPQRADPAYTG